MFELRRFARRYLNPKALYTLITGVMWPTSILLATFYYLYCLFVAIYNEESGNLYSIWRAVMSSSSPHMGPENLKGTDSTYDQLWNNLFGKPVNHTADFMHVVNPFVDWLKNLATLIIHAVILLMGLAAVFYAISRFRFRCRQYATDSHLVAPKMFDGNCSFDSFLD